jgi:CBS domain containing-hemolysin-like protein
MTNSPMSNSPKSDSPMTNSPMSNPDQRPASEAEPAQSAPPDVGDHWLGRTLRTLFGSKAGSIRADLRTALEKGAGEGSFSPKESAMLSNILSLRERRVADVMVPRADIIAVQKSIALGDLLKVFASQAHSRLVVYDDTLDDAIGMVHIRDLIALMTARAADAAAQAGEQQPLPTGLDLKAIDLSMSLSTAKLVRELLFAPPSMPVLDLLAKMQATRIHLALVVDEYGGTDGVVSMEDIVEQIVGEIADEHDEDFVPGVVRQADGSFLANARASLEDATAIIGPEFDVGEIAQEVDTLAGYIATRIGRLPVRGEVVPGPGRFEIEVLDADPRRVKRLKIYQSLDRPGATPPRPAGPSAANPATASSEPTTPSDTSKASP